MLAGIDDASVVKAAVELNESADHGIPVPGYVEKNVSTKVVKIIQSYTGIVNERFDTRKLVKSTKPTEYTLSFFLL